MQHFDKDSFGACACSLNICTDIENIAVCPSCLDYRMWASHPLGLGLHVTTKTTSTDDDTSNSDMVNVHFEFFFSATTSPQK